MSQILISRGAQRYGPVPRLHDWRLGSENDDALKTAGVWNDSQGCANFALKPSNYLFTKLNDSWKAVNSKLSLGAVWVSGKDMVVWGPFFYVIKHKRVHLSKDLIYSKGSVFSATFPTSAFLSWSYVHEDWESQKISDLLYLRSSSPCVLKSVHALYVVPAFLRWADFLCAVCRRTEAVASVLPCLDSWKLICNEGKNQ